VRLERFFIGGKNIQKSNALASTKSKKCREKSGKDVEKVS